jgi:hypothetical protein
MGGNQKPAGFEETCGLGDFEVRRLSGGSFFMPAFATAFVVEVAITTHVGLGTAELERTAHEVFVAQFDHRTTCFVETAHGDKGKAFGTLCAAVHHDFSITHGAHTIEELHQIALSGIVGQIADVEAVGGDVGRIWWCVLAAWLCLARGAHIGGA